ncbi:MAG: hypothetical protein WDZ54_14665 [Sneathiella sp.]
MALSTNKSMSAVEKMRSFKAAWDNIPDGAKKDASLKYYQAAEISHRVMNDAETNRQLDAASRKLR